MDTQRKHAMVGVVFWAGVLVVAAAAQTPDTLRELRRLHERVAVPDRVLSRREAKIAADRLASWHLEAEKLSPEDRARLLRSELYVALGLGRAADAVTRARTLLADTPDDTASLEAVYLAACAAGDARLGTKALRKLARRRKGRARRETARQRRWLRHVGKRAPDVVIHTDDMKDVRVRRRRGRLLLIDFWNLTHAPPAEADQTLVALYKRYKGSPHIQFLGVDADAEARVPEARKFARQRGYAWPQCYEARAVDAPITHKAFHVGPPPWQVLIDPMGYVRAVGDVRTPAFQYALRAAASEARGDTPAVLVCDSRGKRPQRESETLEAAPQGTAKADAEKPSNPDAARKLTLARTYLKTGRRTDAKRLFEEIVRDYPGTPEAREAREYLDSIWNP